MSRNIRAGVLRLTLTSIIRKGAIHMSVPTLPVFNYLLMKVAARCNLDCSYCYWFRDPSVREKPAVLPVEVENVFLVKLEEHINKYRLDAFSILFHGGEPLLFGKERFIGLLGGLHGISSRTGCMFKLSITTNGTLIDEEWAMLFRLFKLGVTLSLDGPRYVHDKNRVDFKGKGSYERVVRGLRLLREQGIEPGVLSVCDPLSDPEEVVRHFVDDLGIEHFDILRPDATCDETPISVASYYIKLFDLWYDEYAGRGIEIRQFPAMIRGLLGGNAGLESIGYGPIQTVTMLTDGALEPLDVLRIAGDGSTKTGISIFTHTFTDVTEDPVWLEAYHASLALHPQCEACEYRHACGGGFLPHRWSKANRYHNPNAYCDDIKPIFGHIWSRIAPDIRVRSDIMEIPLSELTVQ